MMMPTICYKLDEPIVYNKGTKYEKSCDTFLERYCTSRIEAEKECERLNKSANDRIYFVHFQEEMY